MKCPDCGKTMDEALVNGHEAWWCASCSPQLTLDGVMEALENIDAYHARLDIIGLSVKYEKKIEFRECSMCHKNEVLPSSWFPICPNCEFFLNLD